MLYVICIQDPFEPPCTPQYPDPNPTEEKKNQYIAALWYKDEVQKKQFEDKVAAVEASEEAQGRKVGISLFPLGVFYRAEVHINDDPDNPNKLITLITLV